MNRRLLLLAPLAAAGAAGLGFLGMLHGMQNGSFDPRGVPSPLVGQRVPAFSLPGVAGSSLTDAELRGQSAPVLINFFASWCVPCVQEAPVLQALQKGGVALFGIAYKDHDSAVLAFLERNGDPFTRVAADAPGRAAIDWGVTGVPETFLLDRQGVVRWHFAGPLTPEVVDEQLTPALRRAA